MVHKDSRAHSFGGACESKGEWDPYPWTITSQVKSSNPSQVEDEGALKLHVGSSRDGQLVGQRE